MKLPTPLSFDWPLKPPASARTGFNVLPNGSYELPIEHDLIRNVTSQILLWWFRHIGGTLTYRGQTCSCTNRQTKANGNAP